MAHNMDVEDEDEIEDTTHVPEVRPALFNPRATNCPTFGSMQTGVIKRVKLQNFRVHSNLELDFNQNSESSCHRLSPYNDPSNQAQNVHP